MINFKNFFWFVIIVSTIFTIIFTKSLLNEQTDLLPLISIYSKDFSYIGLFLSNFSHAGPIHLLMNMFFFYQLYKAFQYYEVFAKHIMIMFTISFFVTPILTYGIMSFTRDEIMVVGFSGVLFSAIGFLLGNLAPYTIKNVGFLLCYHLVLILLGINLAWEAHLAGYLFGVAYLYYWNKVYIPKKATIINLFDLLNQNIIKDEETGKNYLVGDVLHEAGLRFNNVIGMPFDLKLDQDYSNFSIDPLLDNENERTIDNYLLMISSLLKQRNYNDGIFIFR